MKRMTLVLMALAAFSAQAGQVYKWTDSKGRVHYGDKPVANAKKIEVNAPGSTPAQAPADDSAERMARECESKREQLLTYKNASRVIERDNLGKEKEYTEAERQILLQRTQQQIDQYCSGNPPPGQQQAQRSAPPPVEPPLVAPKMESEGGQ